MAEGLLTPEEVQQYLNVDQSSIDKLVRSKKLTCFKLGGAYLRYSKDQVMNIRATQKKIINRPSLRSRVLDFWRYNGFYFISAALLVLVLYVALFQ